MPYVNKHDAAPDLCQWFYRCLNKATTTRPHPILGAVPICERCNNLIGTLDNLESERP